MKLHKLLIFIISLIIFNATSPYIIKLEALKKTINKKKQYLINAGDIHFGANNLPGYKHPKLERKKIADINKKHAQAFFNFTKKFSKKDCLFILEDTYNYQGKLKYLKKNLENTKKINQNHNFSNCMSFINDHCQKNKISIKNIEFRQGLGEFMNNKINAKEFLIDFIFIINEIKKYNDGKILNKYYSQLIKDLYKKSGKLIKILLNNKNKYFKELTSKITEKEGLTFLTDYFKLIDARIVHTIFVNKNKKYIFLCAGYRHIENINPVLTSINYKKTFSKQTHHLVPTNVGSYQKNVMALK
ncbi:MAG: hypothetical protein P4L22_07225 [Candidatus Babeliales bacterium]|nr:hypothetical protein [Candidatus Babeliales bacterium]